MRKREGEKIIAKQAKEIAALKAELATLKAPAAAPVAAAPKPVPVPKKPKVLFTKSVPDKAEEPKEEPEPTDISAANEQRRGPLAVMTPEQLAEKYGSAGYDDLVTPINDHDGDWRATSAKLIAEGGYKYE